MFTPETWIILSKQLVNNWSALEDAIHLQITSNLSKGIEDGTQEWYKSQLKQIPDLQKRLSELINQQSKKINAEVVDAVKRAISLANTETIKAVEAMTGEELGSLSLDERVLARTSEKLIDWTKGQYTVLFNQAVLKNSELMNTIKYEADLTNRGKKVASFNMRESQTRVLFDSIKRQTEESIERGFQVVYSNGSRRSYKTYMEMNIRSTVQSIALDMMESSAGRLGIEMFLASEHADCADDHVPWQGRVFIADNVVDRWNGKYERIGVAKAAGFTTRPNCRHYWMPITESQANNLEQTKAELRTQKGTYREKNYQDLVKQRYNERNIRKYKSRVANAEKMLTETTDPELAELLKNDIARNNQYVRAWQKRQRDLLAKNTYLKREYRRESPSKMAQDLGVSIERKLGIDLDKSDSGQYNIIEELKTREYHSVNDEAKFIKTSKYSKKDFEALVGKTGTKDLQHYTNRHYDTFWKVNKALRDGEKLSAEEIKYRDSWSDSLSKFKLAKDITTYRGINISYNKLDIIYTEGQIINNASFLSTSIKKEVAEQYSEGGVLFTYKIPKGFNCGAYLQDITKTEGDKEFLISYQTDIYIESVEHNVNRTYITAIAIPRKED